MTYSKKFTFLVKAVAVLTTLSFVGQDVTLAQGAPSWKTPASGPAEALPGRSALPVVSEQLGTKRSEHLHADARELIINIQDAHASIGSQKTTAKILAELVGQYDLDLIGIEGTTGAIDTGLVASFPDRKVRESVAEALLRDTRIGGAEFFKIVSNDDVELVGIEDPSLYKNNIRSYQRLILDEKRIRVALTGLKDVLVQLEQKIYSDRMRTFHHKRLLHEAGELKFSDYWTFLKDLVAEAGVDAGARSNLSALIRTAELEAKVHFDRAGKQRERLIAQLKKTLNGEALEDLSRKAVQFKSGELSQGRFNAELIERARVAAIDPAVYGDFILFAEYVELYESVDFLRVFDEMAGLEAEVQDALLVRPEERSLAALNHTVEVFAKLVEVKLSSADERYFREHRAAFDIPALRAAVEKLAAAQGVDASAVNWRLLGSKIPDSDKFYRLAKERDETMLANLIERMRASGRTAAAIVTGGFHTQGISELMRERRVSHVVYMPKFDGTTGERPYATVITQKGSFIDASIRRDAQLEAMALVLASAVKNGARFDEARRLWIDSYRKDALTRGASIDDADLTDENLNAALEEADEAIRVTVMFDAQGIPQASSSKVPIAEYRRALELGTPLERVSSESVPGAGAARSSARDSARAETSSAAPSSSLAVTDPAVLVAGARMGVLSRQGRFMIFITPILKSVRAALTPAVRTPRQPDGITRRAFLTAGTAAALTVLLPGPVRSAEPSRPADRAEEPEPIAAADYSDHDLARIEAELKRLDIEIKQESSGLGVKFVDGAAVRPRISNLETVFRFQDLPRAHQDLIRAASSSEPDPNALFQREISRTFKGDGEPHPVRFHPVNLNYKGFNMLARALRAGTAYTRTSQDEAVAALIEKAEQDLTEYFNRPEVHKPDGLSAADFKIRISQDGYGWTIAENGETAPLSAQQVLVADAAGRRVPSVYLDGKGEHFLMNFRGPDGGTLVRRVILGRLAIDQLKAHLAATAAQPASERAQVLEQVESREALLKDRAGRLVQNYQKARERWLSLREARAQAWYAAHEGEIVDSLSRSTEAAGELAKKIENALAAHQNAKTGLAATPAMFEEYLPKEQRRSTTHYRLQKKGEAGWTELSLDELPPTMLVTSPKTFFDPERLTEVDPRAMLDAGVGFVAPDGSVYTPIGDWRVSPRLMETGLKAPDHGYRQNHYSGLMIDPVTYEIVDQGSTGDQDPAAGAAKYTENDTPDHYQAIGEGEVPGGEWVPRVMAVEVDPRSGTIVRRYTEPSDMQEAMLNTLPVYRIDDDKLWKQLQGYTLEDRIQATRNTYPLLSEEEIVKRAGYYLRTFTTEHGRFANWAPFMFIDPMDFEEGSPNFGRTRYQLAGLFNPASQTAENPMGNRVEYGSTPAVLAAPSQSYFQRIVPGDVIWPMVEFAFHMSSPFGSMNAETRLILERSMTRLTVEGGAWLRDPLEPRRLLPFNGRDLKVKLGSERVGVREYYQSKARQLFQWLRRNKTEIGQRTGWERDKIHAVTRGVMDHGMIADPDALEPGRTARYPMEYLVSGAKPAWEEAIQQLRVTARGIDQLSEEAQRDVLMLLLKKLKPEAEEADRRTQKAAAAPVVVQGARMSSAKAPLQRTSEPVEIAYLAMESGFPGQPKVGGQYDVLEGLPWAMARRGHAITVVAPRFNEIRLDRVSGKTTSRTLDPIQVPYGRAGGKMTLDVSEVVVEKDGAKVRYLFLKDPDNVFFTSIYHNADGAEGFFEMQILPQAMIELARRGEVKPQVIHGNDWQTALLGAYLRKTERGEDPALQGIKLLYTSHNMNYLGIRNGYLVVNKDFAEGPLGRKLIRDGAIRAYGGEGLGTADLEEKISTEAFAVGSQHILHLVNDRDPSDNLLGLPGRLISDPNEGIEFFRGRDVGGDQPVDTGWKIAPGKAFRFWDRLAGVSEGNLVELSSPPSDVASSTGVEGVVAEMAAAGKTVAVFNGGAGSPADDPALAPGNEHGYSSRVVEDRAQNKRALFYELAKIGDVSRRAFENRETPKIQFHGNLPTEEEWARDFIIGGVSRIAAQKGLDDITEDLMLDLRSMAAPDGRKPRLVLLGNALATDPDGMRTQQRLIGLANQFPDVLTVLVGYDEPLAKHLYASIDAFMMNSYFEPAGISMQIANEYGAPVIAPLTGGLNDFFGRWKGQGFPYKPLHPRISQAERLSSLREAVRTAFDRYANDPAAWSRLVAASAEYDGSWDSRVPAYEQNVYRPVLAGARLAYEHPGFHFTVNSLADLDRLPVYQPGLPSSVDMPNELRRRIPGTVGPHFQFQDPSTEEGKALIASFVEYLSAPYSPDLLLQQKLVSTLNRAEDWDRWPVDSIREIYRQVILNSIRDIAEFKDLRSVEAARRRIYNIALMDYSSHYYQRRRFSMTPPRDLRNPRWRVIHDDLVGLMRSALESDGVGSPEGRQMLESLIEISVNKNSLNRYAFHRQHTPRRDFDSTVEHGLDRAFIPEGSENTDAIFFTDGHMVDSIYGRPMYQDQPELVYAVRIDAASADGRPHLVKGSVGPQEIGDMDADFLADSVPVEDIFVVHPLYPYVLIPLRLFRGEEGVRPYEKLLALARSWETRRVSGSAARMAGAMSDDNRTWLFGAVKDWLTANRWTGRPISSQFSALDDHVIRQALPNRGPAYRSPEEISGLSPEVRLQIYGSFLSSMEAQGLLRRDGGEYFWQGADAGARLSEDQAPPASSDADETKAEDLRAAEAFHAKWSRTLLIAVQDSDAGTAAEDRASLRDRVRQALRAPLNIVVVPADRFEGTKSELDPLYLIDVSAAASRSDALRSAVDGLQTPNADHASELKALFASLRSTEARAELALSDLPDTGAMDHYVSMLLAAAPERRDEIVLSPRAAQALSNGRPLQPITITLDALLLQDAAARELESRQYAQLGLTRNVVYPQSHDRAELAKLQAQLPDIDFKPVTDQAYESGDFLSELYPGYDRLSLEEKSLMVVVTAEGQKVAGIAGVKRLEVSQNSPDGHGAAFVTKATIEVALFDGTETPSETASMGIEWTLSPDGQRVYRYVKKMEPLLSAYIQRVLHSITQTSTSA